MLGALSGRASWCDLLGVAVNCRPSLQELQPVTLRGLLINSASYPRPDAPFADVQEAALPWYDACHGRPRYVRPTSTNLPVSSAAERPLLAFALTVPPPPTAAPVRRHAPWGLRVCEGV